METLPGGVPTQNNAGLRWPVTVPEARSHGAEPPVSNSCLARRPRHDLAAAAAMSPCSSVWTELSGQSTGLYIQPSVRAPRADANRRDRRKIAKISRKHLTRFFVQPRSPPGLRVKVRANRTVRPQ